MQGKPSILIVGAGAMGMVTGYHFGLAGAQVTFLVRPTRVNDFRPPQILYCYDDGKLKEFSGYRVVGSMSEAGSEPFDFVIVTLDGATTRSSEGTELLRSIGNAIRPTRAMLLMGGVGIGLREHYLQATGLPEERVTGGFLGLLSHQVLANLPLRPPTDPALLAKASIAYRHFSNKVGFFIETRNPEAAREFAAIYNRCGVSRCGSMNKTVVNIITNSAFPMLAASEIAGWPAIDMLVANKELWQLACRAQGEITRLPQHGWIGKLMPLIMTAGVTAKLQRKLEKDMLPLDYQAFNRFHHGGKVHAQDVQVMQNCVAAGIRQGQPMAALKELLARLAAHQASKGPATA